MKGYDAIDDTPLPSRGPDHRPRRRTRLRFLTAVAATLISVLVLERYVPVFVYPISRFFNVENVVKSEPFDFFAIEAKETLEFHPCFEDFQCAKLKLPLDYFNGTHQNATVSVAIAKLPAQVPVDDPRYGGPVLINPGGPGGSGVYLAKAQAKGIQTVIDTSSSTSDKGKYYDVIGFDPRGIANTEPAARCMPDGPSSWSWRLRETTEGMLGSSDAALGRLWSMTHAFGTSCKQAMDAEEGPDIKQYMSTASVARDMLEIAEKHANWVTDKAKGLSVSKDVSEASSVKLQYWGFSYGTYLGATFASMFPDRVGRLVLDGVVNVQDYNNALGQGSLHDSEKDMKSFYTFCHGSGPELCPLTTSTSNVQNIEQRVQKIIKSLYHNPLMITTADHGPDIFTYTDLKSAIFSSLYTPAYAFQFVADILAAVENRGGPIFDQFARSYIDTHIYQCPIGNSSQPVFWDTDIPQSAILCGDGIDQSTTDIERFDAYWQTLQDISPSVGPIWAMLKMKCAAWHIKPKYRLGGDEKFHGHTSQPILWVSNTADPVTPLRSARLMQDRFPGSGLLVQDSAGHCSSSTPTPCTIKHIKEYFQTGALPDPQIVCAPPISPFSLNSTDPDSPFYDPSLGQALFLTEEGLEDEMYAAKQLQSWAADHDFLGRSLAGQRVKGLMRSLSMHGSAMMDGLDDLGI